MNRVASIVVRMGGKVLLGKRKDTGRWTLPSGHADEGETMLEAGVRELFEETGIAVTGLELRYLGTQSRTNRQGEPMEVTGYEVVLMGWKLGYETNSGDPDEEVSEWSWFERSELPELHSEGMKLWI